MGCGAMGCIVAVAAPVAVCALFADRSHKKGAQQQGAETPGEKSVEKALQQGELAEQKPASGVIHQKDDVDKSIPVAKPAQNVQTIASAAQGVMLAESIPAPHQQPINDAENIALETTAAIIESAPQNIQTITCAAQGYYSLGLSSILPDQQELYQLISDVEKENERLEKMMMNLEQ